MTTFTFTSGPAFCIKAGRPVQLCQKLTCKLFLFPSIIYRTENFEQQHSLARAEHFVVLKLKQLSMCWCILLFYSDDEKENTYNSFLWYCGQRYG